MFAGEKGEKFTKDFVKTDFLKSRRDEELKIQTFVFQFLGLLGTAVTRGRNIQPCEGGLARVPSYTVCRDTERSTHRGRENCSSS